MTILNATGDAAIQTLRFTDAGELAHAIRGGSIDYLPLDATPYDSRLTFLQAGSLQIQRIADRPHIARGQIDADRMALLFSVSHHAAPVINGYPLNGPEIFVLRPGEEIHAVCAAPVDWAALSLAAEDAEMLLDFGRMPAMHHHAGPMLLLPAEPAVTMRKAITEISTVAEQLAGAGMTRAPGAMVDGLLDLCIEAVARAERGSVPSRVTREALRLLDAAEAFLRANLSRPIYTDELCKALAVSPRKLHHAFNAACGMSPHAYLKRRRLMLVHQALKADSPEALLVKSVALEHGFWHLGNFAHDYKEQFGQSPSDTLAQRRAR